MGIIAEVESYRDDLIRWRRDIHAHPELAYCERRTAAVVGAAGDRRVLRETVLIQIIDAGRDDAIDAVNIVRQQINAAGISIALGHEKVRTRRGNLSVPVRPAGYRLGRRFLAPPAGTRTSKGADE